MAQQIAKDCFGFYSMEELAAIRDLIAGRRTLANKRRRAGRTRSTVAAAEANPRRWSVILSDLKGIIDDDGWIN